MLTKEDTKNNTTEMSEKTIKTKGDVVEPQPAKTLKTVLEKDNAEQSATTKTQDLETKITELDKTLLSLDKQLADKGITIPSTDSSTSTAQSESQTQRIQAIKDRIESSQ